MPNKDSVKLPLELVAQYTKKYPGVWDAAQEMREMPTGSPLCPFCTYHTL